MAFLGDPRGPNGMHQHQQSQPTSPAGVPPGMSQDTPLAYYTPIAITPGTIKWFFGAMLGIVGFLAATPVAERYMMPAKDSDLQSVRMIVEGMRGELKESRDAIARLTLAVDNLSGIVAQMRTAAGPITRAKR